MQAMSAGPALAVGAVPVLPAELSIAVHPPCCRPRSKMMMIQGNVFHFNGLTESDVSWIAGRHNFTKFEDRRLRELVEEYGSNWAKVAAALKTRSAKQCRDRYKNYLDPNVRNQPWTPEEENLLERKVAEIGRKWTLIAKLFENRSEANVKNHWTAMQSRSERSRLSVSMQRPRKTETNQASDPPEEWSEAFDQFHLAMSDDLPFNFEDLHGVFNF
jgi:hypothetical protein